MTRNTSARQIIRSLALLTLTVFILSFGADYGFAYNWPWDQGHDCVETKKGSGNWGRWDYAGNKKGKYCFKECCEKYCEICPVSANTGRLRKTFTDLTLPGIGLSLKIIRTYDSQGWSNSLLGGGWIFNLGKRLIITRSKSGEKLIVVRLDTGEKNFFKENNDGTFTRLTDYGVTYDLIKGPDGTYTINNRNGSKYELTNNGKITKIIDRNQNELVFTHNSVGCLSRITDASGNYVDFQLGPNGKIASISDNLGRSVSYSYDQNSALTSVTDPLGNTTQYVYNSNNLLVQIIDPRGNTVLSLTYDNNQPPRVSTFTEKGETYTVVYYSDHTVKTDSSGNSWTYYFNDVGIIEKVIDPLGNVKQQHHNKVTSTSLDWAEDLNGNRTTYTYDQDGNINSKTDPLGNTWTYTYIQGTNFIETTINPFGMVTKYEYDSNGNRTRIIKDFGGSFETTTSYTYDSNGNMLTETDPLGHTTNYEYDTNGNRIKVTDPLGNVTSYTYDNRGNKLTETDALGNITTYTYDLVDQLASGTDPLGNISTYTYDANGNKISVTDKNGNTTTYTYDAYNRLIQETDPLGNTTSYAYDFRDNRINKTDANSNTTTYTYDILDRLISEIDPLGGQITYIYDPAGNVLKITDANSNTKTYIYDAKNRKISETNALGETINYTYSAINDMLTQTFPNGNTISYSYDLLGNLIAENDSLGNRYTNTYNAAGLLLTVTDALGNVTSYGYDSANRLIKITDPLGNETLYSYDVVGNLITITDREDNVINYSYDPLRRKVSETNQLGNTTQYSYDSVGNLLSITDANGNITSSVYDALNRCIQTTYADGTNKSFTYDADGNLITKTNQDGQVMAYNYDKLNRKIMTDYPGSNDSVYTYDAVGNLLTANNQNANISFIYDNLYRLTQYIQNGTGVSYSYNTSANTKTITYPDSKVIKEVKNLRDSIIQIEDGSSQAIVKYTYDGANIVQSKEYINGIKANLTYNPNHLIKELSYINGNSQQIAKFQYDFDKEGKKLYEEKLHETDNSEAYSYDAKYQLIEYKVGQLISGSIPSPVSSSTYNLDPSGNWNSVTKNGVIENRSHNVLNQIISIDGLNLSYDSNGNLIDDGVRTYSYNTENRLTQVISKSDGQIILQCKYDALNRRIVKTTYSSAPKDTHFLYDGRGFLILAELDSSSTIEKRYIWGPDLSGFKEGLGGIGGLVAMEDILNENNSLCLYNDKGNVHMLVDMSTDQVVAEYSYSAFGELLSASGVRAASNPFRLSTKYFDTETGLYNYGYRFYSSELGRWISQDPMGEGGGLNLYAFVQNNPINSLDPLGLFTITVIPPGATRKSDCGSCEFKVKWGGISNTESGWVIQHVKFEPEVKDCNGNIVSNPKTSAQEYTEGWQVVNGQVYIGFKNASGSNKHGSDTFRTVDEGICTMGKITVSGKVKFIKDYNLTVPPWGYTVPAAGALPTIVPIPSGWSDSGATNHKLVCEWDCCFYPQVKTKCTGTP